MARVVVACEDASVLAAGQGTQRLLAAGISVVSGVLAAEAAGLYLDYQPAVHAPETPKSAS